jgi:hypothetical protein
MKRNNIAVKNDLIVNVYAANLEILCHFGFRMFDFRFIFTQKHVQIEITIILLNLMKFRSTLLLAILLSAVAYSQSKNNISLVYGAAGNDVDIHGAIGDFGYNAGNAALFGVSYIRSLTGSFSIESGMIFSDNKTQLTSILAGRGGFIYNEHIKMLSLPILLRRNFLKYFYFNFGLNVDMETNYPNDGSALNQSGMGYEMGLGGQYNFNHFSVFAAPFFQAHGLIRFNDNAIGNLLDAGVKFGAGYNF